MIDNGLDRRTQRTREMLIHALLDLIETKSYDQITVQEIVDKANVGRSTFYAHYQNKDELLNTGFEHMLDMLVQNIVMDETARLSFNTTMLFYHAKGHYEIYRTLAWGEEFTQLTNNGHAALSDKIEKQLASMLSNTQASSVPLPILTYSLAASLLTTLKWWLENKMPHSPEYMDEIFQKLIMPGIRNSLDCAK